MPPLSYTQVRKYITPIVTWYSCYIVRLDESPQPSCISVLFLALICDPRNGPVVSPREFHSDSGTPTSIY